jgi:hypothetical protein
VSREQFGDLPIPARDVEMSEGNGLVVWDADSGTALYTICRDKTTRFDDFLCFTPDSTRLLTGSINGVEVWMARTGLDLVRLPLRRGPLRGIGIISSDGNRAAFPTAFYVMRWQDDLQVWNLRRPWSGADFALLWAGLLTGLLISARILLPVGRLRRWRRSIRYCTSFSLLALAVGLVVLGLSSEWTLRGSSWLTPAALILAFFDFLAGLAGMTRRARARAELGWHARFGLPRG